MFVFPLTPDLTAIICGTFFIGFLVFLISRRFYWLEPLCILIMAIPLWFLTAYGLVNYQEVGPIAVGPFMGVSITALVGLALSSYTTLRQALTGR